MAYRKDEYLQRLIEESVALTRKGKVADYIPALARASRNEISAALYYPDGSGHCAGEAENKFSLQSISKVLMLALVLMEEGEDVVFSKVGMEPTGDPFNSIIKLEKTTHAKPFNPMINAGALAVTSLLRGESVDERINKFLRFVKALTGDESIDYNKEIADSEFKTSHLNRSLCYYMKQYGVINEDVEELMDLYTKQCAVEVNVRQLAKIGCIFAFDGYDTDKEVQVIPVEYARLCNTFMVTCGMYDASGEFAIRVGFPAKSGVSGAIMGVVPRKFGLGVYSPALDEKGNSIAGLHILENLSKKYSLSIF